ncbi:MAG: PD-(D/E)XK nuclease family protein [Methanoregula sp.]|uniref:PD-(D/E)XK nuclease family protein n=1 Tax=Methanoregula sp. TaxID=2052170 RepID=UPI0025E38EC1|nr:PD-(D/E)XK nuclease family protein [Methanoregula sp.]MCK9632595.1 PD-(D/E)XK nuclease family protein [Methanoregula sp.]
MSKGEAKLLLTQILEDPEIEVPLFKSRDRASSGTVDDLMTFMNVTLTRKVPFPECLLDLESEKSDQLDTIITEYRSRLRKLDLYDGNTILEWAIDFLNHSESSLLGTVFIYGFHEPLPLEKDLFETIQVHVGRVFIFIPDGIDRNIFRTRSAEGNRPGIPPSSDASSAAYQISGLFSESGIFAAGDFFNVETFPTRYAEVYKIAAEICRLNSGGIPLSDIAVAFPDLRGDLSLIEEVFSDFGIPWNAAVGPRFSRAQIVQFLIGIASLASSGYVREDVVRFIGSPFFHKGPVPGGSSGLDAKEIDLVSRYAGIDGPHPPWMKQLDWLHQQMEDPDRAKNFRGISLHTVNRVREGMQILIRDLDSLSEKKILRDHILAYQKFLESWDIPYMFGAPDKLLEEREIRNRKKFLTRLQGLEHIAWLPADEPISSQDFSRLLSSISEEPDDTARQDDDGVTLLGIRECEHMKFPVVFIGGLTEGVFPSLTTRLPFTNSLENVRMGTRSLSEILREVQYYFIAALLSAKSTIYLSAPLADGEKLLLTSAFFERVRMRTGDCPWPASTENPVASRRTTAIDAGKGIRDEKVCTVLNLIPDSLNISDLTEHINMERFYRRAECDSAYDGILSKDESISAALAEQYGADHVWSPTSLETYATCPFAYFLNRVIGLEALPEVEPNLSASDRGTAIHNVLSTFYREWRAAGNTKITLSSLADATEMIIHLASAELEKYSFQSPLWDATRILMLGNRNTGPGYFERFLESETQESDSPLVPSRFEFSFGMETDALDDPASSLEPVELASPDGTEKLRIRGRIDRIDVTPEGQFLIYDYKSGASHPKAKDIVAGTALQLPLYLLAFEQITGLHGIGGGYYKIRREVERNIVLADSSSKDLMISRLRPSVDFPGTIQHSRECAFAYIDGIRNGRFPLPPEEKCPNEYCDFKRICRFDPYRILETGEET